MYDKIESDAKYRTICELVVTRKLNLRQNRECMMINTERYSKINVHRNRVLN